MEQKTRHQKAESFRQEIALTANRNQFINSLLIKDVFDDSDKLRITILFQKSAYLNGCEDGYAMLIQKINSLGDSELAAKISSFTKKIKKSKKS